MARLIDADDALKRFIQETEASGKNAIHINIIKRLLQDIDTAYDVEKVVEALEKAKFLMSPENEGHYADNGLFLEDAIEIVRKGGVDNGVCKWKMDSVGASIGCRSDLHHTGYVDYKECPYCGKEIKVVEE